MYGQTELAIAVAIATLVLPAIFLAALLVGGLRRSRSQPVGARLATTVTVLGGASLGVMVVMGSDLLITWPILATIVVLAGVMLRGGRPRLGAWFIAAAAMPWTIVAGVSLLALLLGAPGLDPAETGLAFVAGAVPLLIALVPATARRLPDGPVRAGASGRSFGDVGAAVRAPALIGPFGLSEVALLVAAVATWFVVGPLLPATIPQPVRLAVLVVAGAVLGAEAYIRAMPAPAREAFEAFSWLGEWEIAQVRALTNEGVPTTELAARRWLRVHPETAASRWIRVEMLTFIKRYDDARAMVERMPADTPEERVDRATAADFVDWFSGGEGDIAAIEAAAAELRPADGDPRLRAEVAIAIARVRRRVASGDDPVQAGAPLREVRKLLGRRADGQVGRALRVRIIRPLLILGALLAVASLLAPDLVPL